MRSWRGRTVLVTGGAGFIGSHLTEALVGRGAEVTVVDDLSTGSLANLASVEKKVRLLELTLPREDLDPLLAESRFDFAFHLAGHVDIPASVVDPAWDLEVNGVSTFRLLDGLRRLSPDTRLLFASSAAVYGEGGRPLREEDPARPISPYGASKLMGERYLAAYASSYGLRSASLRLFPVYGPRLRKHVVHDFIAKLRRDPEVLEIHGDGTQVRDFTYVTDAVAGFLLVARSARLDGEVYNLASGRPMSIAELAREVGRAMGLAPELAFTGSVGPGVSARWTADVSRLRGLGFTARVPIGDGLRRMLSEGDEAPG